MCENTQDSDAGDISYEMYGGHITESLISNYLLFVLMLINKNFKNFKATILAFCKIKILSNIKPEKNNRKNKKSGMTQLPRYLKV